MKNLRFISGLFFGLLIALCFSFLIKCRSAEPDQVKLPDSFTAVPDIGDGIGGTVYKMTIDNVQYIVVEANGGVGIVRHK